MKMIVNMHNGLELMNIYENRKYVWIEENRYAWKSMNMHDMDWNNDN